MVVLSRQDEKQDGSGSAGLSVAEGPGSCLARAFDSPEVMMLGGIG